MNFANAGAPGIASVAGISRLTARPRVSVVIPVLNEVNVLAQLLAGLCRHASWYEIIVVDGGSTDATPDLVRTFAGERNDDRIRVTQADGGRAQQMNAGAALACGDALVFLHADTHLPKDACERVQVAIADGACWGRFDVCVDDDHFAFRIIERLMNLRSAVTGLATGDQAIFVRRDIFRMLGGYAPIPLMEDIELCTRLKWVGWPVRIAMRVRTSARRWRRYGIARTVAKMWLLRLLYRFGVAPARLARFYLNAR
jgi:rSAM/selenodomain-associated transferase 2